MQVSGSPGSGDVPLELIPVMTWRFPLQIESGFFHESDVKIVAKSIRDRVALIQWRRKRIWPALQPQEQSELGSPDKARGPPTPLQVQVTYHSQAGLPESEEPEADQHLLTPALPASATSLACECCLSRRPLPLHRPSLSPTWGYERLVWASISSGRDSPGRHPHMAERSVTRGSLKSGFPGQTQN